MNRETFQRYALVTIVLLLGVLAVNGASWRHFTRHFGERHRGGERCRMDRHGDRHVERHVLIDRLPAPPPPPPGHAV